MTATLRTITPLKKRLKFSFFDFLAGSQRTQFPFLLNIFHKFGPIDCLFFGHLMRIKCEKENNVQFKFFSLLSD